MRLCTLIFLDCHFLSDLFQYNVFKVKGKHLGQVTSTVWIWSRWIRKTLVCGLEFSSSSCWNVLLFTEPADSFTPLCVKLWSYVPYMCVCVHSSCCKRVSPNVFEPTAETISPIDKSHTRGVSWVESWPSGVWLLHLTCLLLLALISSTCWICLWLKSLKSCRPGVGGQTGLPRSEQHHMQNENISNSGHLVVIQYLTKWFKITIASYANAQKKAQPSVIHLKWSCCSNTWREASRGG